MPHPFASSFLNAAMGAIALAVAAGFIALLWNATKSPRTTVLAALALAVLMTVQYQAASSGILRQWERRPPPIFPIVAGMAALSTVFAFSKPGRTLAANTPLALLIATQGFRLPLELVMHRAAAEHVMPIQMSYSGYNFDILTGTSALVVAALIASGRAGRTAAAIWNIAGSCLLLNIVSIAIASMPLFRLFGDDRVNDWIAYPPFVWLAGVLVPAALLGHLLVWRKLALSR